VGSQAFRHKEPLACIVVTPMIGDNPQATEAVIEELAKILRATGRSSDVIGTLGPGEFGIVAGGTDGAGAERFAERLADAAGQIFGVNDVRVAVGYDVVPNYSEAPIDPTDMLSRASAAMRKSQLEASSGRRLHMRRFESNLN
jgi:GGDEF domain-containing protein